MSGGRRGFLKGAGAVLGSLASKRAWAAAMVTPDAARPSVEWGAASGDVTGRYDAAARLPPPPRMRTSAGGDHSHGSHAVVWSRTDRPARMIVEWSTTDSFGDSRRVVGPAALEDTGFTARVDLAGLPSGQRIVYRVTFQDLTDLKTLSLPVTGALKTPPAVSSDVRFIWSADTVGQGWGINPEWGGLRMYETMRQAAPDFFVHQGDTIYADNPLVAEVRLDDGTVWKNLVTPAKSKVAETLDEFRGNYVYNLLDANVRRFNAEVPVVAQWDDHEVLNNWYPTRILEDPRYGVKSAALLAARAKRAFLEHHPLRLAPADPERIYRRITYGPLLELFVLDMRSYRGPNSPNRQATLGDDAALLGPEQLSWLETGLLTSKAVWKVVASDMPLGVVVRDGERDFEAVANADDGPPLGRELEIARVLRALKSHDVRNVVWLTADLHYATAHRYDPERAAFKDFLPFWEFVAGPIHAGTFGPAALDGTFGPEVKFVGIPAGMKPNRPPSDGFQFFGAVNIEGKTRVLTVSLHDLSGRTLYSINLDPARR